MTGCDQFEVAIEMQRRGALKPAPAAELQAHLRDCASCRAYEASAERMEDLMTRSVRAELRSMDWGALELELKRRAIGPFALTNPRMLGAMIWTIPLVLTGPLAPRGPQWLIHALFFATLPMIVPLRVYWRWRRTRKLSMSREQTLGVFRLTIDQRIRDLRFGMLFVPPMAALLVVLPQALEWRSTGIWSEPLGTYHLVVRILFFVWAVGQSLYDWRVNLPRLLRERDELC